jgi:4-hydroxy-2-oxoheptanedioate aldolase
MATFLEKLKSGPQLGLGVFYPAAGITERIGPDWDFIWIDGQHGQFGYKDVLDTVRACDLVKKPAMLRVPGHEAGIIGLYLDTACAALMVPMIETAEEAKAIVQAAKFPPLGKRSFGGRRPIDLYTRTYAHQNVPGPLLIVQIESLVGLENVEKIAAVEGIDGLFFGPDDMALREGLPMDVTRAAGHFDKAHKKVADAARKSSKICGGCFFNAEAMAKAVEFGYTLNVCCGDVPLLANGSKAQAKIFRELLGQKIATAETFRLDNY